MAVGDEGGAVAAQCSRVSLGVTLSLVTGSAPPLGLPGDAGMAAHPLVAGGEDSQSLLMMSVVLTS